MVYFNIFSIIFYIATLPLLRLVHFRVYVVAVYLEILLHTALAEYFVGWQAGFQVTLIGLNILCYFVEYLCRILGEKFAPAMILCFIGMITYIGSFIISYWNPPPYTLSPQVILLLQIVWGLITFIIVIICLQCFVWLTFSSEKLLTGQVITDALTGLHNRYYITKYLNKIESSEQRDLYWVALIDIDNFKSINDTYGHNYGDYVLKTIADILRFECLDMEYCRWGGEEFLILGKVGNGMDEQWAKLDLLRMIVETYDFNYEGQHIELTITIGVTRFGNEGTALNWINQADQKLYQGKQTGKNKVVM